MKIRTIWNCEDCGRSNRAKQNICLYCHASAPRQERQDGNDYSQSVKVIKKAIKCRLEDKNWTSDAYSYGRVTGMIYVLSVFENKKPEYPKKPEVWLKNNHPNI